MRVLDLFAGLGGWSKPFIERGHDVVTVDIEPSFGATITADVLQTSPASYGYFDAVLASPPCEKFSVMTFGRWWGPGYEPSPEARYAVALVHWTAALIESVQPAFAVIENPRGLLRKLPILDRYERVTVTQCQYGMRYMKPTDLWGAPFPPDWHPRPMCRNGASCHVAAPRGSRSGVQSDDTAAERAEIPYELAMDVCLAAESSLALSGERLRGTGTE